MLILIESLAMCFIMLIICVIGSANGPEGAVFFYESEVQKKVVELGLITKEEIRRRFLIAGICLLIPILFFVPAMVYYINGTRGFVDTFVQIITIYMILGVFDKLFIDWYWVGKTKAWYIPGTDELMPYISKRAWVKKWIGVIIVYPLLAVILSAIISLF